MARIDLNNPYDERDKHVISISKDDDGVYDVYLCGTHQSSVYTDRESLERLRDMLNDILAK